MPTKIPATTQARLAWLTLTDNAKKLRKRPVTAEEIDLGARLFNSAVANRSLGSEIAHLSPGDWVILTSPGTGTPGVFLVMEVADVDGGGFLFSTQNIWTPSKVREKPILYSAAMRFPRYRRIAKGYVESLLKQTYLKEEGKEIVASDNPDDVEGFTIDEAAFKNANALQSIGASLAGILGVLSRREKQEARLLEIQEKYLAVLREQEERNKAMKARDDAYTADAMTNKIDYTLALRKATRAIERLADAWGAPKDDAAEKEETDGN